MRELFGWVRRGCEWRTWDTCLCEIVFEYKNVLQQYKSGNSLTSSWIVYQNKIFLKRRPQKIYCFILLGKPFFREEYKKKTVPL